MRDVGRAVFNEADWLPHVTMCDDDLDARVEAGWLIIIVWMCEVDLTSSVRLPTRSLSTL